MSDGDVKRDSDGTRRGAEIRRCEGIPLLFLQWGKNCDIVPCPSDSLCFNTGSKG